MFMYQTIHQKKRGILMLKIFLSTKGANESHTVDDLYPNAKHVHFQSFDLEYNFYVLFHELRENNGPVIVEGALIHPQLKKELASLATKQDIVIIADNAYAQSHIINDACFDQAVVQYI